MAPCALPLAPANFTPAELIAARNLHNRLDRWSNTVMANAIGNGQPVRYVVARVGTDGLKFLMDPELGHFTNAPANVLRFDRKPEAVAAMLNGHKAMEKAYNKRVADIYWKGQRIIPIYHDSNPHADLPTITTPTTIRIAGVAHCVALHCVG